MGLEKKNHHIFCDNFFTSVKLFEDLEKDGIHGCGTVRRDRKGLPLELCMYVCGRTCVLVYVCVCVGVWANHMYSIFDRGECKIMQKGPLVGSAWRDNRVVTALSTTSQPIATDTVLRRQKDRSRIPVTCPESIIKSIIIYNKHIGGGDQLRGYYSCRIKSRKFYKYVYYFLFDVAITNSYILHKNFTSNTIRNVKQFRLQLAKELIGTYRSRKTSGRVPRTFALQHFPLKGCLQPSAKRSKRGRCEYCSQKLHKRSDNSWMCQECGVWLCHDGNHVTDCFYLWHKSL
ncbi:piggyBac transposable element-derived protein 1-like [Halichondria panicea]|uniref:piggyBac transposable element-derived protein 1-like n=1 Tax=Halichondria panicea TaxID=6063 RepID=UPI00312B8DFF